MRSRLPLLASLLALPACDVVRSAEGTWAGSCDIDGRNRDDEPFAVTFELSIDSDDGEQLLGRGSFDYGDDTYTGDLKGDRFDEDLWLELHGRHEDASVRLELYGELEGDRVLGECAIYGIEGDLTMRRTGSPKT